MKEEDIIKHKLNWKNKLSIRKQTNKIVIHCTASREGQDWSVEGIHNLHLGNGWAGIGYNFVIYRDGSIHEGRPINAVGAHCPEGNCNTAGIGIVYVGGVDSNLKPKDTRTPAQKKALLQLVYWLKQKYPNATIHGHNEFAAKACPSFSVKKWIEEEYKPFINNTSVEHKCILK